MSNVKGGALFAAIVGGGCAGLTAAIRLDNQAAATAATNGDW